MEILFTNAATLSFGPCWRFIACCKACTTSWPTCQQEETQCWISQTITEWTNKLKWSVFWSSNFYPKGWWLLALFHTHHYLSLHLWCMKSMVRIGWVRKWYGYHTPSAILKPFVHVISKPELMECCDIGNENVNPNSRAPAAACVENSELSLDTKSVSFLAIKSYSSCTSPSEYCIELLHKQFKQIVFFFCQQVQIEIWWCNW